MFLEEPLNWVETAPSPSSWLDMKWATDSAALHTGNSCVLKHLHFHRKDDEDGQLTAAQIYLKLGEVSAESGKFKYGVGGQKWTVVIQSQPVTLPFFGITLHCLVADR